MVETFHAGDRIRQVLKEMKMSSAELARRLGTSNQSVSNMLNRSNIGYDLLMRINAIVGRNIMAEVDDFPNLKDEYNELLRRYVDLLEENRSLYKDIAALRNKLSGLQSTEK